MEDPHLKACNENFTKTFEWVASVAPSGAVENFETISVTKSGLANSGFNMIFVLERPSRSSLSGVSESIRRLYIKRETPWQVVTTPHISNAIEPLIQEFGLEKGRLEPGMVLEYSKDLVVPRPPPELEIKQVQEPQEIETFLRIGMQGFGDTSGTLLLPLANGLAKKGGSFQGGCYLGFASGKPVSTSLRFNFGNVAGIYFVATLEGFRRRGYGEALTWRAALDGQKEGCIFSSLQASEMGLPIYEKMGYRKIVDYEVWRPTKNM